MWFEKATLNAGVVELVDAIDSKSIIGNYVWVRVPLTAEKSLQFTGSLRTVTFAALI